MKNFRRLLRLFAAHWPTALVAGLAMSVVAIGNTAVIALIRALIDLLKSASPGEHTDLDSLALKGGGLAAKLDAARIAISAHLGNHLPDPALAIPALLIIALFTKSLGPFGGDYLVNRVGLLVVRDLRQSLYDSLLSRSVRFFADRGTGELTSRVMADVERIQASLGGRFGDLVQDSLSTVLLFFYVISLDPHLALITFVLAPIVLVPVLRLTRRLRRTASKSQERVAELNDVLQETIRGQRIVKAFGMEEFESRRFRTANLAYFRMLVREARISAAGNPLMEAVAGTGMVGILVFARHRIATGQASLGTFVAFLLGIGALYAPLKRLNKGNLALQQALAAASRVFAVLDVPHDVADRPDAKPLPPFSKDLRFEEVRFEYDAGRPVLGGIDLTIRRGEVVAFVGSSGAGKSTLVHLVPRFFDVTGGAIRIDGVDLRGATLKSLRSQVSLVTQDVFLFNDTVRNNIAYGREDVPFEKIRGAAGAAFALDFIEKLPNGWDSVVGEAGVRLSGGQKQRIAIARALLKDAPILVLDEATSALDVESERMVQSALENLMAGRTTLVVAHRLSTIRRADRIVVMEQGVIVEIGTHDELLAKGGVYARLHAMQFEEPAAVREETE